MWKFWYPRIGLVTTNTHVKYQSCSTYRWSYYKIKVSDIITELRIDKWQTDRKNNTPYPIFFIGGIKRGVGFSVVTFLDQLRLSFSNIRHSTYSANYTTAAKISHMCVDIHNCSYHCFFKKFKFVSLMHFSVKWFYWKARNNHAIN